MKKRKLVPYILVSSLVLSSLSGSLTVFAEAALKENKSEVVTDQEESNDTIEEVSADVDETLLNPENELDIQEEIVPKKENRAISTGQWGSSPWILEDGVLTIKPGKLSAGTTTNTVADIPKDEVTKIIFDGKVEANNYSSNLFNNFKNLQTFENMSNFDTSNVTQMQNMFQNCVSLTKVDLSGFNTSKVTTMNSTFKNTGLTELDLSPLDMGKVTAQGLMLAESTQISKLTLGNKNRINDASLPAINTDSGKYSGAWESTDGKKVFSSSAEFMTTYDAKIDAGTYVWEVQSAPVTVKFVDKKGKEIAESEILTGKIGGTYETKAKEITNYQLKETPGNAIGTFSEKDQTVTYVYENVWGTSPWTLEDGVLTVKSGTLTGGTASNTIAGIPKDEVTKIVFDGKVVANSFSTSLFHNFKNLQSFENMSNFDTSNVAQMQGMFQNCVSLTKIDLSGFNTSKVWTMNSMFRNTGLTELDMSPLDMGKVTAQGSMLADSTQLSKLTLGDKNKLSTTNIPAINTDSGKYTGAWESVGGEKVFPSSYDFMTTFDAKTDAGTYVWEMAQSAPVTVNYIDEKGVELSESDILTGEIGDAYQTEAKIIEGYTLKTTPKNTEGVFGYESQTVTYVYSANVGAPVTVRYINQVGNEIAASTTLNGKVGQTVTGTAKTPGGYTLTSASNTQEATIGTTEQTITFEYQGNAASKVTTEYVDTDGVRIAPVKTISGGNVGDAYTTEAETIQGYTLQATPENASGFRTQGAMTVTYVYKKNAAQSFAVNYVGVQQQKVVGFVPEGVTTSKVSLMIKKDGTNEWVDTGYTAAPEAATGYFAIESRFVKDTRDFLLNNKDQIKVVFTAENGDNYEGIQVVQPYTAPVVNDFTEGDEYLTGSVPNGANQVRVSINGNLMRVVNNGPLIADDAGIDAVTGAFSIWAKTWCEGAYGSSPIQQTKTGDVITVDYGVQIYGAFNNPSTTIIVK